MGDGTSPMRRFLLHVMWMVLPFCALVWIAWRASDSQSKLDEQRRVEQAGRVADRAMEEARLALGDWSQMPQSDVLDFPPLPPDGDRGRNARERYEAGDYEGVLGSPASIRSEAGLPLRSLAALQLMRKETDFGRLDELANIIVESPGFVSPLLLEEAERRFTELGLPLPVKIAGWRKQWAKMKAEPAIARELQARKEWISAVWLDHEGTTYLVERGLGGGWRVNTEDVVVAAASESRRGNKYALLPDGLAIVLSADEKPLSGPADQPELYRNSNDLWMAQVVLVDAEAFYRYGRFTRNFVLIMAALTGLAATPGLVQAVRSYARAVELARRQGEFMAAVSHEMRTPLAAMRLLAENLESGVAERAGKGAEHARMIREECTRLGELVGNVLAFSRKSDDEPREAFDVAAVVGEVAALVRPLADRKGIDFVVRVEGFFREPEGEVESLRRLLLNLLDNALKHTPEGGSVVCEVLPDGADAWRIEVRDSGPGVPVVERKKIFEAFYRIGDELRRTTPGTGLGLALVKRTAEAHGGEVRVTDAVEGGACFTVVMPLGQGAFDYQGSRCGLKSSDGYRPTLQHEDLP